MPSYLNFVPAGFSASGKTKLWGVQSTGGAVLGTISWFAQWRKYTFEPQPGTVFDSVCLGEIANFIATETYRHKEK
jgi:hypothetical protein